MSRHLQIDDLFRIELPSQPSLSPDGSRVVYCVTRPDAAADANHSSLWIADTDDCNPRRLTAGPGDSHPIWSPDGSWILFTRDGGGHSQLWLIDATSGHEVALTDGGLDAGGASFSPDGRRVAFTAGVDRDQNACAGADPAAAALRPMVADRLDYQADGQPWRRSVRRQVHVVDMPATSGGTPTGGAPGTGAVRLTDGDWDASAPAWSPDGTLLAFTADVDRDSDITRTRAVHVIASHPSTPPAAPRQVGPRGGHLGSVRWLDDSTLLAGGRIDTRCGHDSFWRIDLSSGDAAPLAPGFDRGIMRGAATGYPGAAPQLVDGGATVLFCAREAGCTYLYAVPAAGGTPRPVIGGEGRVVSGMSAVTVSGRTRIAVAVSDPGSFGEIVVTDGSGRGEHACTEHGAELTGVTLLRREPRYFTISDGTRVQGWLLRDPAAHGPGPLLLDIHGGPHNAWNAGADPVHLYHQVLAARGWTVLTLNPRASDGYGEAFFTATVGGWGRDDARDFLEPLDRLVDEGIADPARLSVTGYSYGGFMTCYLTAHDRRFAAAVTGGPVTDLISDCGTSDDGRDMADAEMGGAPWWSDPGPYRALSPLQAVADVETPTLILQGDQDVRCPRGQAQQWFAALRGRRVPARLVLYPGSSHLFPYAGRPSHRVDYNERIIDWVQRFAG